MVYEPREDSFLLLPFIKSYAKGRILDMGCGSGILAKEAMKFSDDVIAADIDIPAVKFCKKQGINSVESELFSNITGGFDLIIFNPPYLPNDAREDKDSALATSGGKKGHEILERFLREAKKHINDKGNILVVISSLTGDVESLFKRYGYMFRMLKEEKYFFESLRAYLLGYDTQKIIAK